MLMIQRLRLLIVTLFAIYNGSAFALSLGEIELKSTLNQRFDGEIILSNVGDLELGEIISNLATQEDFDRVGVNRDDQLTDIRFNTRVRDDGVHIIHLTSITPIVEPFLNFIVETIWPTGRIMSE
jgi:pilus assembly protein FimV